MQEWSEDVQNGRPESLAQFRTFIFLYSDPYVTRITVEQSLHFVQREPSPLRGGRGRAFLTPFLAYKDTIIALARRRLSASYIMRTW
jgi:hypothetical protein